MKKLVGILLFAALTTCYLSSCGKEAASGSVAEVWTEDAQAKILRNAEYEDKTDRSIDIQMARNEYQGAQIQVHANRNIHSYNLEISDLYSDMGIIESENIEVTVFKYMPLEMKSNILEEFEIGSEVPDAMIPLDAIKNYGEDKIERGDNQGFYLDIHTPKTIPDGVYTGTATLTLNNTVEYIDIKVTVWDITLPDQLGTKNYWGLFKRNEQLAGELDTSDEMATKYFEFLLKYNINCELLPFSPKDGPEGYVELLRKYYNAPGFNTYRFYHEWRDTQYGADNVPWDVNCMRTYLKAVIRAAVEDRTNYLDKAIFYMLGNMDEPHTPDAYEKCVVLSRAYGKILSEIDAEMRIELSEQENYNFYLSAVSDTLLHIPAILTLMNEIYFPDIIDNGYTIDNLTVCMVVHGYDKPTMREEYAEFAEKNEHEQWWYTCTGPVNPYPSTHIDDYAVSARLLGWMGEAYDVDGYLNWGTFITRGEYGPEVYESQASVWNNSNGDGWIAYPGKWYGVDGPIASLRLVAMRDGMQDRALLEMFVKKYEEKGLNAQSALEIYYQELFSGTQVLIQDTDTLYRFRNEIAANIMGMDEADVIYDAIRFKNNIAEVSFAVGEHVDSVQYNGETLTPTNHLYTIEVDLKETVTLTFTLVIDGASKTVTRQLCGGYSLLDNCDSLDTIIQAASTLTDAISLNEDARFALSGNSVKVMLLGKDDQSSAYSPSIRLDRSAINGGDWSEIKTLTLNIYNASDEVKKFAAYSFNGRSEQYLADVPLNPGWNVVNIPNLNNLPEDVSLIRIKTDNFYGEPLTLYVDDISIIKV